MLLQKRLEQQSTANKWSHVEQDLVHAVLRGLCRCLQMQELIPPVSYKYCVPRAVHKW